MPPKIKKSQIPKAQHYKNKFTDLGTVFRGATNNLQRVAKRKVPRIKDLRVASNVAEVLYLDAAKGITPDARAKGQAHFAKVFDTLQPHFDRMRADPYLANNPEELQRRHDHIFPPSTTKLAIKKRPEDEEGEE